MNCIPFFQIDAFSNRHFEGNPAAVCLLDRPTDEKWMQSVAAEMNLSETAFVVRKEVSGSGELSEGAQFGLRWFTPAAEVDLCGHATLAAAHSLWESGRVRAAEAIRFDTASGQLTCVKNGDWITLDFPAAIAERTDPPAELLDALSIHPVFVGKTKFDFLIVAESEEAVRAMKPNFAKLRQVQTRGVIVTSRAAQAGEGGVDFVSRFFGPAVGIDEDPVTGSAHCCLATYWAAELGKNSFTAYQASARGGLLRLKLQDDRVKISGQAITVVRGEMALGEC